MRKQDEYEITTNRYLYNRVRKFMLNQKGLIRCSYCGYHLGENCTNEVYGGFESKKLNLPNWKLVSKNPKQWMKKKLKYKKWKYHNHIYGTYIGIEF